MYVYYVLVFYIPPIVTLKKVGQGPGDCWLKNEVSVDDRNVKNIGSLYNIRNSDTYIQKQKKYLQ